jgi:hypothetical protein
LNPGIHSTLNLLRARRLPCFRLAPRRTFSFRVDEWTTQVRNSIFRAIKQSMASNAAEFQRFSGKFPFDRPPLHNEAGSLTGQRSHHSPRSLATAARPFRRGSAKGTKERGLKRTRETPPKPSAKLNFAQFYASPTASDEFFPLAGLRELENQRPRPATSVAMTSARSSHGNCLWLAKAVGNAGNPRLQNPCRFTGRPVAQARRVGEP